MSRFERANRSDRRVVITGIGLLTPLGLDSRSSWEGICSGKSGIEKISAFDTTGYGVTIAGEIKGFDPSPFVEKKEQKKMDRFIHYSLAVAQEAIADSGLDFNNAALGDTTGCFMGVGIGGLHAIEAQHKTLVERGPSRITPFFIPMVISNMASGQISIRHGLRGPNYSVVSACASGAHSIGEAAGYIRRGLCQIMLAGGAEAAVTPLGVAGFAAMKALSTRNNDPHAASRPFDKDRDGFVIAEGAAALILEDFEHATKRGAKIYGEIIGYGASSDAYHMTNPAPEGAGAAKAMLAALKDANLGPDLIQYINAHGTSTPAGDGQESQAVHRVFAASARKVWMSSTKSMIGHSLGAAGAIEAVLSVLSLRDNIAPPTINLDQPSEDCDLDYVPKNARQGKFQNVMSNSFGFGGTNATLVFAKI